MILQSPEGFLTFVLVPKTSVFGAPRRFPFFLVPKTHVLGEPRRFPAMCFWCPSFIFLESPEGFLTFVFGAENSYFWIVQKVSWLVFWYPKLMVLESPEGLLTFVFGAQNSYFWRAQKVS